jgi:peptide-methionine (S)-S-oxide reductase
MKFAVLGAGCFWCIEAIFGQLDGVVSVKSGYTGGTVENPTYEQICTGNTNHAEVCKITYDPKIINYEKLLHVFFENHDPTTLNQQGADKGTQYRSAIFYSDSTEQRIAIKIREEIDKTNYYSNSIVTEISKLDIFYEAEDYHQNYYEKNSNQPYCRFVIKPKLDNFLKNKKSNQ